MSNAEEGDFADRFKQDMDAAIQRALSRPEVVKLLEGTVVEFAAERKVDDVVQRYLRSRVYPSVLVACAVLGLFGWGIDRQLSAARDGVEAQVKVVGEQRKVIESELRNLTSTVDAARQNLRIFEIESRTLHGQLKDEINGQRQTVDRASRELDDRGKDNQKRIEREAASVSSLREKAGMAEERFSELDRRLKELHARLEDGLARTEGMRKVADLQGRVLNSAVIEFLTMRSNTRSAVIDLPKPLGAHKLQFQTPNIKDQFDLSYRVDGDQKTLSVSNGDKWSWHPLVGTEGRYEFRVDHVFHSPGGKVPDFVTLRVRSTANLTPVQ